MTGLSAHHSAASGTLAPLSPAELRRFCDVLYARTGIAYDESKRSLIERRLGERLARLGLSSYDAYLTGLGKQSAEIEQMINLFTINETYFYRETHQLACLSRALLPEIMGRRGPGDLLRLWSCPCSTGEEPYSIAIWLLQNWPKVDAYSVDIIGSDIDTRALAEARAGRYGERALSRLPAELVRRYFEPQPGGHWQIIKDLRRSVDFAPANIVDPASIAARGRFDVIFCRNVLIYFNEASRLEALHNLYEALNPGGFLCLGHSEFMARFPSRFVVRRFEEAIVYQRPAS